VPVTLEHALQVVKVVVTNDMSGRVWAESREIGAKVCGEAER
jgi:hypothetical protein